MVDYSASSTTGSSTGSNPVIEWETPDDITLQFVPAGLGARLGAVVFDTVLIVTGLVLFGFTAFYAGLFTGSAVPLLFVLLGALFLRIGYWIWGEWRWFGQTIGKSLAGIQVLNADGRPLRLSAVVTRNLLREVEYGRLDRATFVPAPGQGALAVVAREGGATAERVHDGVDHPRTRVATTVERTVLAELGGGCVAPIGVSAHLQGEYVHVVAVVCSADGERVVERTRDLPVEDHAEAASDLAGEMADEGAAGLIEEAREAAAEGG